MVTKKTVLLAKAEFFLGRQLTAKEKVNIMRKAYEGTQSKINTVLGTTKRHIPVGIIIEKYIPKMDKMSTDELIGVVNEMIVKSTSVDAGIKILRKALTKKRDTLISYLVDLYIRDTPNTDLYKKAAEPSMQLSVEQSFSNVDPYSQSSGAMKVVQPTQPAKQEEYTSTGYKADLDTGNSRQDKLKEIDKKNIKKKVVKKKENKLVTLIKDKVIPLFTDNVNTDNYKDLYENPTKRNEDK